MFLNYLCVNPCALVVYILVCDQAKSTSSSQISRLLDIIPKRGNCGFETFLKAMVDTHQESLALLLDEVFASDLIEARGK